MIHRLTILTLVLAALLASGCRRRRHVASSEKAEVKHGRALYGRYCALCHGKKLEGYAADHANALGNPEFLAVASDEFLRRAIVEGRPGTPMSAWAKAAGGPLEPKEIDDLIAFLRSLGKHKPSDLVVEGDPNRGAVGFAYRCAVCHGARGQGTERATSLSQPGFLATAGDGFLRTTIEHGRRGTPMPGFSTLPKQELDDLVAFVRTLGAVLPPTAPPIVYEPPPGLDRLILNPTGGKPTFTLREGRYVPSAQVAKALEDKRRIVLLDARPTSDWSRGHIVGALPFPFYDIEKMARELPRDGTWIVAYCACPHAASGHVVDELRKRKFANTAVLDEGITFWTTKGYPVAQAAIVKASLTP